MVPIVKAITASFRQPAVASILTARCNEVPHPETGDPVKVTDGKPLRWMLASILRYVSPHTYKEQSTADPVGDGVDHPSTMLATLRASMNGTELGPLAAGDHTQPFAVLAESGVRTMSAGVALCHALSNLCLQTEWVRDLDATQQGQLLEVAEVRRLSRCAFALGSQPLLLRPAGLGCCGHSVQRV